MQLGRSTRMTSTKTTTIATNILLDDARNGFKNGNFVCSPFSLEISLGMLAPGAEGQTLKQLLGFLGHETLDQLLYESPSSKLFARILSNPRGGVGINLANGIWLDKKLMNRVQSCYDEVLKTIYKTKASFVDFEHEPDESAKKINSWVNEKTGGLIPTIVEKENLERVVIVLANALYFKGLWYDMFDPEYTHEKDFHLINGETVSVPFMTSYEMFNHGSYESYEILQLRYKDEGQSMKFSMYIFLPNRKDGLQDLLQLFHSDPALFHSQFNLEAKWFDKLWIPKFKISYEFEAQDVMQQMGLTLPFEPTNMEFSRIVVEPRGPGEDMLYVSKVLQKSFIEVNETGTEAAACSLEDEDMGCSLEEAQRPKPRFVADHPFMFMIREDTSRAVFFIGVVLNPHKN